MKKRISTSCILLLAALTISCATAGGKEVLSDGRTVYKKADSGELEKKDAIRGRVTDSATGKGIKGAVVEIKNANLGMGYYRLETDSGGNFRIDDFVKHVRYKIEVSAALYVPYVSTETIQAGKYSIELQREGILSGTVRDSAGVPVSGVEVRLSPGYDSYGEESEGGGYVPKPLNAVSDANGAYVFNKLSEGAYVASFQKQGYITETARIKAIKRGESFNLPMMLIRPASVSGRISIQGIDAPAINMDISLSGRVTHSTTSYQDGSYRLEDIKPGNYRINLSHQGFYKLVTGVITIKEGDSVKNLDFTVKPKEPQLSVYAYRYTFAPGSKVEFNLRTFRLEKIHVKIFRVPMGVLLGGKTDPNKVVPLKEGFQTVKERDDSVRDFEPYEWRYQSVDMNEPLPPGGYCIEVSGAERIFDRKFFTVTTAGLLVKRSRESVFAYVTNLVDNRPVSGASIVVFDNTPVKKEYRTSTTPYKPPQRIEDLPVTIVHQGRTGDDGTFHYRLKSAQHLSVLAIGTDGSYAFTSTGSPFTFAREENKYFIYTDRPVYRAGDKVHYKIIGKKRAKGFTPIAAAKLHYRIRNVDFDETAEEGTLSLDDWGSFGSSINLAPDAHLGEYEIRVGSSPDNLYGTGRFYLEQYRKPEFKIDITPAKDYFTNGDTAEFKVEGKYFFGAPLKGALVKYRFYESRLRDTDTTYWWEEDYGVSESYSRIKLEGDKYLDDNGIAVFRLALGDYPYDREIVLETTITDQSNVSITSRSTVKVGRGEYYIKINPVSNFYADDEKKNVIVRTMAYNGSPVSAPVEVKVFRYVWKPWQRVYVHDTKPVFEKSVHTDKKGLYELELPKKFDLYGEFDITAESKDRRENRITASRVVWVYSSRGAKIESRFRNLEIVVNNPELERPGEITCLVKSRFSDGYVCLTLEGRDIYDKKVIKMNGNVMPVKLMVKGDYAPNLYVTAAMQRSRALFTSTAGVSLPNPDSTLAISLTPDKLKCLPGEKVKVAVKTTDEKGSPVNADLSLGIVDEAIYQIRSDHTPKMRDFFYSKISNWVLTSYSYPITILAGAGKEGKVKIREKFEDTAYWKADIRTGADGESSVEFTVPDNLTTWRLTARGHDRTGRVGEKRSEILVTQDLIARIGKPRFFVEGDTVSLIGIVNSNTTRGLASISTEMKVDNAVLAPDEKAKISLPAFGSARAYYTTKVPSGVESTKLDFKSVGDADARDALRLTLPVHRRGAPYKLFATGDMAQNRSVEIRPLGGTDDFDFIPEEIVISVNPGPIAQMLKASKYLAEYPYGCIEQTIDRFLPNLALKKLLERKGLNGLTVDDKLDEKIAVGIEGVSKAQNDDGTWGWWAGDRGNEFITGYVLYSLYTARKLGYSVDLSRTGNGLAAIERIFQNPGVSDNDAKAYLLYMYALWGKWSDTAYRQLAAQKNPTTYQTAFLLRAMAASKKIKAIKQAEREKMNALSIEYISRLKNALKKDGRGIYWESAGSTAWGWQGGVTEITAHVLSALVEAGDRSSVPAQLVSSLAKRSRGDAWNSTKETAMIFFAFVSYLEEMGGDIHSTGEVAFSFGGKNIATIPYDTKVLKDISVLKRKIKLEKSGPGTVYRIDASGTAGADVSFDVTLSGTLKFKEAGFLSLIKSEGRSVKALENGLSLARSFHSIMRVRDINNAEYMVPQDISGKTSMKVGDEILVKVKLRPQDDFEYLVLEDYLPSGFEVVLKNAYDEYQPYSHIERWDNRMVFFFSGLRKGEVYELAYIIRAELPGEFMVKPSRMECMYEPSIQGWSVPAKFRVEKK